MISRIQIFLQGSHILAQVGFLILLGYAAGWAARKVNLPRITGYIVVGMVLSFSGVAGKGIALEKLSLITDLALSVIAFSIGGALRVGTMKKLGGSILWITLIQGFAVFLLVWATVLIVFPLLLPDPLPSRENMMSLALFLGAVCVATAPAAVLGVIHEYHAKGPVTTVLLGIVTLDDALTLVFFSLAAGIAGSLTGGSGSLLYSAFLDPAWEIFLSLLIGAAAGLLLRVFLNVCPRSCGLLGIALGSVFLVSGLALTLNASSLLACMALGFTLVNLVRQPEQWFEAVENIEEPIFALFFVIAGAHLELEVLLTAGGLGLVILVSRGLAKAGGAFWGAMITGSPPNVRKYVPLGLLPQAGVAIALVLTAADILPDPGLSRVMVNAVLASVVINELVSPPLVRLGLSRAGEIKHERGR
ncbi:MAG: cation:proton antiporter [Proteobacteria bacterium]|nr:cation:proton antiporter [Pseudomonadota bacterium]